MKKILFIAIVILLFCVSCELGETKRRKIEAERDIQLCRNAGGIPIRSTWDGRLKDCIFPPNKTKVEENQNEYK